LNDFFFFIFLAAAVGFTDHGVISCFNLKKKFKIFETFSKKKI
jgi:hypothetical protein